MIFNQNDQSYISGNQTVIQQVVPKLKELQKLRKESDYAYGRATTVDEPKSGGLSTGRRRKNIFTREGPTAHLNNTITNEPHLKE